MKKIKFVVNYVREEIKKMVKLYRDVGVIVVMMVLAIILCLLIPENENDEF